MGDEEEICVSIDFSLPFTVTHQLHTCRYRKFIGVNITCHTDWFLALREPEIIGVCQPPNNSFVNLTSLNSTFNSLTVSILTSIQIVCGFFFFYHWVKNKEFKFRQKIACCGLQELFLFGGIYLFIISLFLYFCNVIVDIFSWHFVKLTVLFSFICQISNVN